MSLQGTKEAHILRLVQASSQLRSVAPDTTSNETFIHTIRQMNEVELRSLREAIDKISLIHVHVEKGLKKHHELEVCVN